jgi:hypothetical protein
MPSAHITEVKDSVPKINNEVAVGEDLKFQRHWWRFENAVWVLFTVLVVLDVCGVFGRGPAAKAHARSADGALNVSYERVERFSTPSILDVRFDPSAIHDGKVQLWVNEPMIKALGTQRVVPQPLSSVVGDGGILYTFPVSNTPASIQFALEPASPGIFQLALRVPGGQMLTKKIVVMP